MVGMTGAGKSLMINNIVNYVFGVTCEDNFRFKLILDEEEIAERGDGTKSTAESMTKWVTSYKLGMILVHIWYPNFEAKLLQK